jgi:predicted alpha/beta superfamily hydrolase
MRWRNFKHGQPHTVVGTLLVSEPLTSAQLGNARELFVWLPNSYERDTHKRYPVLYMHDGNNLFDAYTSFAGEWRVDETLTILEDEGIEAIVVGIPNNEQRMSEYSPFTDTRLKMGGRADDYLDWIVKDVKPLIDSAFRTRTEREHTGIVGSSMGGLVSLYGFLRYPQTFGVAGALSPSYWFGQGQLFKVVMETPFVGGKVYLDIGGREGRFGAHYMQGVRRLADALLQKGYVDGETLCYVEDAQGKHDEEAWARRLPYALRFLLK